MGREVQVILGIVVAVIIAIIALVATSLQKLNSDEVGLKYNTVSKTLASTPTYEGLHNGPPGFTFIVFPSVFKTLSYSNLQCLNENGVEIHLDISYQYRIRGSHLESIVTEFKDHDTFGNILMSIGKSAIMDSCSKFNTSQFQSDRGKFQEDLRTRLVSKYNNVYVDVTDLQVNNIVRPRRYENAVREKETAREDIVVARNERPRQLTEAETLKLEADTQATITLDRAYSEARIKETQAQSDGQAILNSYQTEANSYSYLTSTDGLNLDTEAFLAYMGVRVVEEAQNDVNIAMSSPAKTSWYTTT